jgi:hypothetical protein
LKRKNKKRGLSKNQVCVLTAMDRKNHIFTKHAGIGKMNNSYLKSLRSQIAKTATLTTDGELSCKSLKVKKHKRLEVGLSKDEAYNIGQTDELHSSMKRIINNTFRGVATKYLDNYSVYCSALKTKTPIFDTLVATHNRTTRNSLRMKVVF